MLSLIRYVVGCGLLAGVMFGGVFGLCYGVFFHATPTPGVAVDDLPVPLEIITIGIPMLALMLALVMAVTFTIHEGYEMHKRVGRDDLLWKLMAVSSTIAIMVTFGTFVAGVLLTPLSTTVFAVCLGVIMIGALWMILPKARLAQRIQQTPFLALDA